MKMNVGGEFDAVSTPGLKREMPLVPADSVATRALVVVIAIMTFLACLTAGGALLIAQASQGWRSEVAQDVTIQIKPRTGDDIDAIVAKAVDAARQTAGVSDVRALTQKDSERMLEPWLGEGLDFSQLPVPRLIIVRMTAGEGSDLQPLRTALAAIAPSASVDDQSLWISRLDTMADVIVLFAAAVFALVIIAMATAIGFATRGAMAGNREIIEVLHFVGAADSFVAAQFQVHFMRVGSRGSAIGGGGAALFFITTSVLSAWWAHSPGGEEIAALFGAFALNGIGYLSLVVICVAIVILTGYLSRAIVFRHLQSLL